MMTVRAGLPCGLMFPPMVIFFLLAHISIGCFFVDNFASGMRNLT